MAELLSIVETAFFIQGRGVVVEPGVPAGHELSFAVGDALQLVRPDRSELMAVVRGIEMMRGGIPYPLVVPRDRSILLGPEVTKEEVPEGTELWVRSDCQSRSPSKE